MDDSSVVPVAGMAKAVRILQSLRKPAGQGDMTKLFDIDVF
jgi:hypothetical protein